MTTPPSEFNELIHAPVRLRICALLRPVSELEFAVLRDTLSLSDPHLSKNLRLLGDAGFVLLRKESSDTASDARKRTRVSLTTDGRGAIEGHLAALALIAGEQS